MLERSLLQLGRAGTLVDRRLFPGLQRLHSRRLYRPLGYVRLADYLTERLGMSLRRCQAILRLGRTLDSLPRLGRALEEGEVSFSKAEVVAGAAVPETEEIWLERARRLTVASLREVVRVARAGGSVQSCEASGAPPPVIEQEEPGRLISFNAPAPAFAMWHWCLDLIRRVAGHQEPAWRCAEYLAAEFLSGTPDLQGEPPAVSVSAAAPVRPATEDVAQPRPGREAEVGSGMEAWHEASAAVQEALASIGPAADPEAILAGDPEAILSGRATAVGFPAAGSSCGAVDSAVAVAIPGPGDGELDAWELDTGLRRLVRLRQSLAWRQGRLLAALASLHLHRDLGFDTLDDWVGERLPMSPRRARYLMSLDRRLRRLPLLADAYRRGLVSWCQARLLVRVVAPATQGRWIRYARQVTVRRLEEVVVACEVGDAESAAPGGVRAPAHLGASPAAWPAHTSATPLPPSEPSPGRAAGTASEPSRLHTSAPLPGPAAAIGAPTDARIRRSIVFWAPLDVAALWDSALRACRAAAGCRLEDWECFLVFVQALRDTWENPEDRHWRRRYRIFERDGWRCKAPGCTSRSGLNEHHIIFRSQQGDDDEGNLVTLCIGHHQEGVHQGHIRCFGRAPGALWWDLGVRPGGPPLVRYFGERVVSRWPYLRTGPGIHAAPLPLTTSRAITGVRTTAGSIAG